MIDPRVVRFLRRVAYTHDQEIDCGQCSQLSPQYVDALIDGHDGLDRWQLVRLHLEQCTVCAQELMVLASVVRMERDGTWPTVAILLEWATGSAGDA